MAAASYTTDLATINLAETVTNWTEPTGATAGGTAAQENEYFIQGSFCISKSFNATGLGGLHYNNGAGVTIPTDGAVYFWVYWSAPNSISSKATGGQRLTIGSNVGDYRNYYVAGSDTQIYGGWVNYPINPTVTPSLTTGAPTTTYQYFGQVINNVTAISRGNPFGIDAVRYGRGTLQITGGDLANGYANFLTAAQTNDSNITGALNRWGILSFSLGTYKYQGHLLLGTAATAVDFRDSNKAITIQNTEFVTPNFNLIEVRNATSRVDFTGISINSLSTVSRGNFLMTNAADVNMDGCTFTDMGTFNFLSSAGVTGTVFRRCGLITQNTAPFSACTFEAANSSPAILCNTPGDMAFITDSEFISDGTGYGIEVRGTAANTTLTGVTFTGYAATNGTTGNEAIFVNIATGNMTISITGGGNTPSIRTAGATVTVVNAVAFSVTNIAANTEIRIYRQSDMTELAGADLVSASPSGVSNLVITSDPDNAGFYVATYSYNYTTDTPIYVVAHSLEYQWLRSTATLKSTTGSLKIAQIKDRQYLNP